MSTNTVRAKLAAVMLKNAFTPADGLGGMDPAAAGGAPMDPAMMGGGGGMPAGPAPAAPAAPAGGMDPAMMGGDPAAMGGGAPMDPAMMGGDPAAMGGGQDPMQMPINMLTVGDLVQLIGEVVTQVVSGGGEEGAAPAPEADAPKSENPGSSEPSGDEKIVSRLDQLIEMLGGAPGGPEAMPAGPMAGPVAPGAQAPKMASALERVYSVLRES